MAQATRANDTVLDFYAGSGTTGHAVLALNALDGGNRKFILCSSTEATEKEPAKNLCRDVCAERMKRVIESDTAFAINSFAYLQLDKIAPGDAPFESNCAQAFLGVPLGYPEYVLHQMVTVMRSGEEVKISKRAGTYVTVRDLIDEVGRDAVRYFFLMRKGDSQLVFDVDLARTQSEENPVYRIQMAHARVCGIFRVGGIDPATVSADGVALDTLVEPAEQELVRALLDFPDIVLSAASALEPHRIASYLLDTASLVHSWYHKHHVLGEPAPVMRARLVLARASQIVLRNGLSIIGITAPERM